MRARGFASIYRWDVHIRAAASNDLGESTLVAGASIAGWSKSEANKIDGAIAEAWGMSARGADPRIAKHLNRPLAQAIVGKRGFFQITGLPEGTYRLLVKKSGLATATFSPVEVYRGAETRIRPVLTLGAPLRLHLT